MFVCTRTAEIHLRLASTSSRLDPDMASPSMSSTAMDHALLASEGPHAMPGKYERRLGMFLFGDHHQVLHIRHEPVKAAGSKSPRCWGESAVRPCPR